MSRYVMSQKWLSLSDRFVVRDERGREAFRIDGRVFSLGDRLTLRDAAGRDLCEIRQVLLSWGPTYEITRGTELLARVKKLVFTFFRCEFIVDVPGPDDLTATGSFLDHEYRFERDGRVVAVVTKEWMRLTDTYGIATSPGEDDALIVAAAVVIDLCCHDGRD